MLAALIQEPMRAEIFEGAMPPLVSVGLPCLSEEGAVVSCVEQALSALADEGISVEVVVVDNGSTDRSIAVAEAAGARVIREPRRGYGRAIRTGIEEAHGEIVVMADADWSYDFGKLPQLIEPVMRDEADMVLGSRLDS